MKHAFQTIIKHLIGAAKTPALSGIDADAQFFLNSDGDPSITRRLNAAFLMVLSGPDNAGYEAAWQYLNKLSVDRGGGTLARFYLTSAEQVLREVTATAQSNEEVAEALKRAADWCADNDGLRFIWQVFFPEGTRCIDDPEKRILALRDTRKIDIKKPNPNPIRRPARDILFMSNLLITIPPDPGRIDSDVCSADTCEQVRRAAGTAQKYWYDHPIQIGVPPENNEAVYGLRGLNAAMRTEKARGVARPDDKLTCILSVSVTHEGLQRGPRNISGRCMQPSNPFPTWMCSSFQRLIPAA
ncbi:MAG: hypothetical protein U5R49_21380 [Deltaproteobacteria bacterium]|nr:hypothetical protein [Deltaproteobacteria bacterium]